MRKNKVHMRYVVKGWHMDTPVQEQAEQAPALAAVCHPAAFSRPHETKKVARGSLEYRMLSMF